MRIRLVRPHVGRIVVSLAYILATTGLLILAYDDILFDRYAIVGAAAGTLLALLVILATGVGWMWLVVGGAWIYATAIEAIRGPTWEAQVGLSLVFAALAIGALGAYTANRMIEPLRL